MTDTLKNCCLHCVYHCYPFCVTVSYPCNWYVTTSDRYDVDIQFSVGTGPNKKSSYNNVNLKNPYFRFSSMAPAPPPGSIHENVTDQYWSSG